MRDATPIAVTSRSFSRHPVLREELLQRCSHVTFNDAGLSLNGDGLIAFLRGHVRAITALEVLDRRVFESVPELRLVSKYGVGIDMIDVDAMRELGVTLAWTPGVNRRSVAELAVAFMVALVHRVPEAMTLVRAGDWRQITGRQLSARTVGIVGCGNVGKDVVRLLAPFGCRVLVHDIREYPEFYRETGVTPVPLDVLMAQADVVTVHVPLDASTRNLIGAPQLARLTAGSVIVNTARGGIVDERALLDGLTSGGIAGAALDVLAVEPPTDRALIDHPRVLVTPHIGGSADEAILAMGRAAIAGVTMVSPASDIR